MIYQTYPWGGGVYSKSEVNTLLTDYIPKSGTNALSGRIVPSTDNSVDLGSSSYRFKNIYTNCIRGRYNTDGTASGVTVYSADAWYTGSFITLRATIPNSSNPDSGGFQLTACKNDNPSDPNSAVAAALDGFPNGTFKWSGQPIQYVSDQRLKQQIAQIDNALLDAWEDVTLVQFKYNDAVNEKGNAARLHTGYVVQQIDTACKSHDVDISEYGLYCHEEYPEETEEVEVTQDDGTIKKETKVIREASEHYSLRYTETLVVECAYLRRENSRLKERLSKIEKLLNI